MRRRGGSGRPKKRQRTNKPGARKASRSRAPVAQLQIQLDERTRERDEALEQWAATTDVLKVISRSTFSLDNALNALIESATRLCGAMRGHILQFNGEYLVFAAAYGAFPGFTEYLRAHPFRPGHGTIAGRAAATRQSVHVRDVLEERDYELSELVKQQGYRTVLAVPMVRGAVLLGVITILKTNVEPFTKKQIELVETFASQAVIAIENTRLFNELRQRTDDLTESLEQQTATSEVLKVIASSSGELKHVFGTMLANATRLCGASYGAMWLRDGDGFRNTALYGPLPSAYVERISGSLVHPGPNGALANVVRTREPVHISDLRESAAYLDREILPVAAVELAGVRTIVSVPMFKADQILGAITIYRKEMQPFSKRQIELVQNFAAQAVIAIENTRLLSELRESLQQQTATAEVLKVISSSPGELQPVFDAILENAVRICDARFGHLWLREGDDALRSGGMHGAPDAFGAYLREEPVFRPKPETGLGQLLRKKELFHLEDIATLPTYGDRLREATIKLAGARTLIGVPMIKDDAAIGAIVIYRQEVRPFTDKQVELIRNFAAQAVIAIENTRLLSELRERTHDLSESLEQQTATAEVLKIISSSSGDLTPVFKAMLENAVRICEAKFGHMFLSEGESFRVVALESGALPYPSWLKQGSKLELRENPRGPLAQIVMTRKLLHISDLTAEEPYLERNRRMVALVESSGARTFLGVPMFKSETLVGVISIYRQEVRPFTDKQIELVRNFASQAVIAIENTRLLNELRERSHELATSLDHLRNTQDRLVQTQKLASLAQLTAGIAHEMKNPLNFVNNFSGLSAELIDELQESLKDVSLTASKRDEITELMDTLHGNLDKVVQHGKRADAIVKNMLQHSREDLGEHRLVDINVLVEESLNLAWHGARAEKQGFEIELKTSFDPTAGEIDAFPQDIRRALLNLISNGFYAATKRRNETNGGGYEPVLAASTKNLGDRVEIIIRDNGIGVTPDVKEKMFNPFFTTKPPGEGTGLGLSISHDIIVKQHAGTIDVDTQPGEFTEIRVILPRVAALLPERP